MELRQNHRNIFQRVYMQPPSCRICRFFPVLYPFTTRGLWGLRGLQLQLIKSILETLPVLDWIPQNGVPDFDALLFWYCCLQANRPMKFYVRTSANWKTPKTAGSSVWYQDWTRIGTMHLTWSLELTWINRTKMISLVCCKHSHLTILG